MDADTNASAAPSGTVGAVVGLWSVHVIVCGLYVGAYKFDTEAEASADAEDRRRKFGVLGCRYIVEANAAGQTPAAKEKANE